MSNTKKRDRDGGPLPFDGAISAYAEAGAPAEVRRAVAGAGKDAILDPRYPYDTRLDRKSYAEEDAACQAELIKLQSFLRESGGRLVVLFEGRDAAGKGGAIKAFTRNLNPRHARIVALPAPSDTEAGQWYFQRYIEHLPTSGEMVFFDRSWYNRAVVEQVFGFVTVPERERFFAQVQPFEDMLVRDGIHLVKLWLGIGRAEQLRQFLQRERDPLKQWKLSRIDVEGLARWDDYTAAIGEMFVRTHHVGVPWTVIWGDDKRRARIAAMRAVLAELDYPGKAVEPPDPRITGGPDILPLG